MLAAAALFALACLSFLPAIWSGFVSDDFLLLNNLQRSGVGWVFTHNDAGEAGAAGHFYRPVWMLWNLWLFKAFGASTVVLHLANVLLYALVAAGVWALAATLVDPRRAWIAAAAFAVYPRHGESVCWLSGNTDLVAVAAVLGALLIVRSQASLELRIAGVAVLTAAATLSKEIAFVLPVLALLILPRDRGRRELLLPGAILLVEAGAFAARYAVIGGFGGYSQYGWSPKQAIGSAASYTLASAIPPSVPAFRYWVVFLLPLAALALIGWRVLVLRRRGAHADLRLVGIGAAWFAVCLLPLLSLPVDLNNANGERNLLLPSVGLALMLAGLIRVPRRATIAGATAVALAALGGLSAYESFDWIEAGKLSDRLVPAAIALAPQGGELVILSAPEGYRTAHVLLGGDLSNVLAYRGIGAFTTAICAPVQLRAVRSGEIGFDQSGASYRGKTTWAAPFDFPVLHSAAGLTGECAYSRLPGPKAPGMGLRALLTPTPSRAPVVIAYFDGHDFRRFR